MTTIINLKDRPDLLDAFATNDQYNDIVRIDRQTEWGNPFKIGQDGSRDDVIESYRQHLYNRLRTRDLSVESLASLDGKTLACWCVPKNCHGQVLAKAAAWATTTLQTIQTPALSNSPTPSTPDPTPSHTAQLTYAGIGSRKTPPAILDVMKTMAQWLDRQGWHLHSGGANGADTAFAQGARPDQRDIFLPWPTYNQHQNDPRAHTLSPDRQQSAHDMAAALHPAWHKCKGTTPQLHARNVAILLGPNLDTPVKAVVCWTRGGELEGGTAMGIRIAQAHNIPVLNLATLSPREACQQLQQLKTQSQTPTPAPSKITTTATPQDTPQALTEDWRKHHDTTRTRYNANPWDTPGYDTLLARTRALATTNKLPQFLTNTLSLHDTLLTTWQQRLHNINNEWNQLAARRNSVSPFYSPAYPNLHARIRNLSRAVNDAHLPPTEKAPYRERLNTYLNHHHAVTHGLKEMTTLAKLTFTHVHAHSPTQHNAVPPDHPQYKQWKRHVERADLINADHPKYSQWQTRAKHLIQSSQNMVNSQLPDYRAHLDSDTIGARIQRGAAMLANMLHTDQHHVRAEKPKQQPTESAPERVLVSLQQTRSRSRSMNP